VTNIFFFQEIIAFKIDNMQTHLSAFWCVKYDLKERRFGILFSTVDLLARECTTFSMKNIKFNIFGTHAVLYSPKLCMSFLF
jgi:hypothetical protein